MKNRLAELRKLKKTIKKVNAQGILEEVQPSEPEPSSSTQDKNAMEEEEVHEVKDDEADWDSQECEDDLEDEYEEEEIIENKPKRNNADEDEQWVDDGDFVEAADDKRAENEAYLGNNKKLGKGEYLEFDNRAYDMLHRLTVEWPCLSFDFIVGDNPYENKKMPFQTMNKYPYEIFTVQGTQGEKDNQIMIAKWSRLHKTKYDDDSDECEDDEDDNLSNDEDPEITTATVETKYAINRIKSMHSSPYVAFWNENAEITIMDLSKKFRSLKEGVKQSGKEKVDRRVFKTSAEGFALCWNDNKTGELAAGNVRGDLLIYEPQANFSDWVLGRKYNHHKASVEDIQFSPSEDYVFASCSSDGTIQIVDTRVSTYNKSQIFIKAHEKDVNVIDWNKKATHLIASGSDDCSVKIWDLRMNKEFAKGIYNELISFNWHDEPITSISFQPNEESVIAVASEDNRVTLWDLAVQNEEQGESDIPNEMMFIHQGQEEVKEVRYHPIFYEMLVTTAANGLNAFKPSFSGPDEQESDGESDLKKPPVKQSDLADYIDKLRLE